MLKQIIDKSNLDKILIARDVRSIRAKIGNQHLDLIKGNILESLRKFDYKDAKTNSKRLKGREVHLAADVENRLICKQIDMLSRRIYKVKQSDRARNIDRLIKVLKDGGSNHILRLDFKSFYESISFETVIDKLEMDMLLLPRYIDYLRSVQRKLAAQGSFGLPRGLAFSPTLSEIYIRQFDLKIASHPDVIFFTRYVDDVIIVFSHIPPAKMDSLCRKEAFQLNLSFNKSGIKYSLSPTRKSNFYYLGYDFRCERKDKQKATRVEVGISESKLKKFKTKIIKALIDYKKTKDFPLLKRRLYFLSSLNAVKKRAHGNLMSGLCYNYQFSSDFEKLKRLDGFLEHSLRLRRFGLTGQQIANLKPISFFQFAIKRVSSNFTNKSINKINAIWSSQ